MSIDVQIKDGGGSNGSLKITSRVDTTDGITAYTVPYIDKRWFTLPLVNNTYGADMNQDTSFGGTPDGIHNGTDSVLWTGSGADFTFDSTDQAQAGTKSIDATASTNNSEALLTRASTIATGNYVAFTGYIYLTSWSTQGTLKEIELEISNGGSQAGDTLSLSDYIDTASFNVWQKFSIPIGDFNAGSVNIDEVTFRTRDVGAGQPPDYYLDTIQWENTGGSEEFLVAPDKGEIYEINTISLTVVDGYNSTLTANSMPDIIYNQILGQTALTNGMVFQVTQNEEVTSTLVLRDHKDLMQFPAAVFQAQGDGTNTLAKYTYDLGGSSIKLDSRTQDKIGITISEDLSGLVFLRVLITGNKYNLGDL